MAKKHFNSLSDLKSLKFNKKEEESIDPKEKIIRKAIKKAGLKPKTPAPKIEEKNVETISDEEIFLRAMGGVEKIDGEKIEPLAEKRIKPQPQKKTEDEGKKILSGIVSGKIEFEIEYYEDYLFGFVRGIDSKIFQKLKSGSFSHENYIDLHGLNADQAYDSLHFFIRESYLQSKRCILIVTGKGKNSPGGQSILKREVYEWLAREPFKRIILAFCTAQPKDGGSGAIYVLLRKNKKGGKIQWDKGQNWGKMDF
ncbi:Smr/MutS family protein [Maridesulfovibrio bastinii]|jgi:DNA-nicking Smr family endonuclease|uniref:Smr/MutS family protein n=1 Tax=Maridesulfovibrio bastinii TaxID=47157 RepID=UPI000403E575|nr:Smr/MutS family protein [Maridesulfovibrio bastinii]